MWSSISKTQGVNKHLKNSLNFKQDNMKLNLMTSNAITLKCCGQDLHIREVTVHGELRTQVELGCPLDKEMIWDYLDNKYVIPRALINGRRQRIISRNLKMSQCQL